MSVLLAAALAATLYLADDGTPTVRYSLGEGTREGRFVDSRPEAHTVARAPFWTYDKRCVALEPTRVRKLADDCAAVEVRLAWDDRVRDRTYPGVVRLRNGGVLVFTQYLQPLGDDGRLADWEARAPAGGVVAFRGEKSNDSITLGERYFNRDGRGYVYLGPDHFREEAAGRVLVDEGVPAAIQAEMLEVAPRLLAEYGRRLGTAPADKPTLYLTWVNRELPVRDVQADVVPGAVIRFGLAGERWGKAAGADLASFRKLVAHELAHVWNGELFAPRWSAPWVTEGNAELLAVAGLLSLGVIDADGAAEMVNAAYNECAMLAGTRAWVAMSSQERTFGRAPYVCGLAMQFVAAAAARKADPAIDAFELWRRLWSRVPRYYEAAIQQQLAADGAAPAANAFGAMLTAPGIPLGQALSSLLRDAGIALERPGTLTPAMRMALGTRTMASFMQADCHGGMSFFSQAEQFMVADTSGIDCAHFKAGLALRYLEDEDLIEATDRAVAKAREACARDKRARLKARDGTQITVACPAGGLPDASLFLRLDASEVAAVLAKPGAAAR